MTPQTVGQRAPGAITQSPDKTLMAMAARYFLDPAPFLAAFARDPRAAIVALRDAPASFGRVRSYVGTIATSAAHANLLRVARKAWASVDPAADVRATRRRRKDASP